MQDSGNLRLIEHNLKYEDEYDILAWTRVIFLQIQFSDKPALTPS